MAGRTRGRTRQVKKDQDMAAAIGGGIVGLALLWAFVLAPVLGWMQDNAVLAVLLLLLVGSTGGYLVYKRYEANRLWAASLPGQIVRAIRNFKPSRAYRSEFGYHTELQGWLKHEFPSAKVEFQTGASRPDIVVDNVAIEVKGPTDAAALKTLGDKCMRYLQHYDGLVIVAFEPSYTRRLFEEVDAGIKRMFPGKAWLIEK